MNLGSFHNFSSQLRILAQFGILPGLVSCMTQPATDATDLPGTESILNLPNLLSAYRLLAFFGLVYLIMTDQGQMFALFFLISLLSDILDGWIARRFKLQTEFGAKLDSWADTLTYIAGFWGIYQFKWDEVLPHIGMLGAFLLAYLALYGTMFYKFKAVVGLHTYSFKITAYLQGACMMALLWFGLWPWFYYLALGWGIVACLEEIIILSLIPTAQTNVKGLWWVWRGLKNA